MEKKKIPYSTLYEMTGGIFFMNYILIYYNNKKTEVAILEEDKLVEYYIEEEPEDEIVGNIYRGRVKNVLLGMEAAFVDIGIGKNAYLYIKDVIPKPMISSGKNVSIGEALKAGQEIIVQVVKESFQNKGPKVTTHITIPGKYLVLSPFNNRINISKKIEDKEEIRRLFNIAKEIKVEGIGMILRTASMGADKEEIKKELKFLMGIWRRIEMEKNFLPCPKLLYKEMDITQRIVRDVILNNMDNVIVNDRKIYKSISKLVKSVSADLTDKIILDENLDIMSFKNVGEELSRALKRTVKLKSGGYIVIDETEALTAIDVNTGKYTGDLSLESTVFNTNMEAAEEIGKQIRLRDIGGIIVIDFIDMRNKKDINLVMEKMKEVLKKDRTKTNLYGITNLGLVEMTRKKARNTLSSKLTSICPMCGGRGRI